jgi:hypothetical protein
MSQDRDRDLDAALERGEIPEVALQQARDAMVAYYLDRGDAGSAHRLRVVHMIQDRLVRNGVEPADMDQLLALFDETSDELIEAKVIGVLIAAAHQGQVPVSKRDRVIEAGRAALRREPWSTRSRGCALLFALDARSEGSAMMALLEDQDERVRERAAQVLARWDASRTDRPQPGSHTLYAGSDSEEK